jgi:two-component system, NtrC family, sensor histidine kinase HydH
MTSPASPAPDAESPASASGVVDADPFSGRGLPATAEGLAAKREPAGLGRRLAWLTGLRLALFLVLLGLVGFLYFRGPTPPASLTFLLRTLGLGFAAAVVYGALLRRERALTPMAYAQIAIDQLTWTSLAYISGGIASGATSFYGLSCVAGAVLLGVRGAIFGALTGAACLGALTLSLVQGWATPPTDQAAYDTSWDSLSYPLTLNLLVLLVVALLSGYLAARLRFAGGQLEVANARAEKAERLALLGQFAAGLAHEIRNPLGSIGGSAALLADAPGLGDEDRVLIQIIVRETTRLNDLVSDVLDLSKPRLPVLEEVDVARLASEVVKLAAVSGRGLDVDIVYDGPPDDVVVRADSAQLRQVLWNLVRNAVQASAAGTPVRVVVRRGQGRVFLEVRDQGAGISKAAQAQLFDAFYSTRSQGIGIGLAVVKQILEDHDFAIDVDSAEGFGATFRVTIPHAKPPSKPPARSSRPSLPLATGPDDTGPAPLLSASTRASSSPPAPPSSSPPPPSPPPPTSPKS